jgi:hypothetical protein
MPRDASASLHELLDQCDQMLDAAGVMRALAFESRQSSL